MTDKDSARIFELRQQGFGYKRIADALSIPLNTVKSFCRRQKITSKQAELTPVSQPTNYALQSIQMASPSFQTIPQPVPQFVQMPSEMDDTTQDDRREETQTGAERTLMCKQCGAPLLQSPHHRQRQFCSDICRKKWWYTHQECAGAAQERICPGCGKHFISARGKKYCSHACYIEARFYAPRSFISEANSLTLAGQQNGVPRSAQTASTQYELPDPHSIRMKCPVPRKPGNNMAR